MGVVMPVIRSIYRVVLPTSIRNSPTMVRLKTRLLGHDRIYNSNYYAGTVEGPAVRSAGRIAGSILEEFKASRIIDVGCGTGALLEALRERGCEVLGLEFSEAALDYCRARRLDVLKFNLSRDVLDEKCRFDVAISLEVAEHLPKVSADRYIDLLTSLSPVVVFTAAPPGQGGGGHINEQLPEYWIAKFQDRGFDYADGLSQHWREAWKTAGDVEGWYCQNLMVFRQRQ